MACTRHGECCVFKYIAGSTDDLGNGRYALANAMQRAKDFVLERALVFISHIGNTKVTWVMW